MGWQVWGKSIYSSDMNETLGYYQPTIMHKNIILRAARIWLVFYNDPTFDNVGMSIYTNDDNTTAEDTPAIKIADSTNTLTKSQIITESNGVKEIYFKFNDIPLQSDIKYNFMLTSKNYVGSTTSHLAWVKAYPDPVYTEGYTPTLVNMPNAPFTIYFIGGTL